MFLLLFELFINYKKDIIYGIIRITEAATPPQPSTIVSNMEVVNRLENV